MDIYEIVLGIILFICIVMAGMSAVLYKNKSVIGLKNPTKAIASWLMAGQFMLVLYLIGFVIGLTFWTEVLFIYTLFLAIGVPILVDRTLDSEKK